MKRILKVVVRNIFTIVLCTSIMQTISQERSTNLTGTYTMSAEGTQLTLKLKQDNMQKVTGTLSSNTGISYQLDGDIADGIATGICSSNEGSVFFEMYGVENELILSLIEPDASNMPDYNSATYLSFIKNASNDPGLISGPDLQTNTNQSIGKTNNTALTGKEIGDPSWGFKFLPPDGWTHQKTNEGLIMGHTTIAGIILILPHMMQNMQEVQQEMRKGIQEEGNYLSISGNLSQLENNIIAGNYTGIMDGQQVKSRGYGTLSPYGGGAFIIAISTPEKLGDEIINDAKMIASNLIYEKINTSDLMRHFAGKWTNFTTNTSTWLQLYPDGTYDEQYESSYSGDLSGGGNWGIAGNDNVKGRWTIRGNKDSGSIIVHLSNGNEIIYEYRVHEERGEKYYAEYWFNGKLYSKSID